MDEQLVLFRAALQQPAVRKILSKAAFPGLVTVQREQPFAVRVGDQLVNGRIDRLVWCKDPKGMLSAEVIDFKTDSIPAAAVPQRVEFYRPQIDAYLRAIAAFGNIAIDRLSGVLVFTSVGRVERLANSGE